MLTILPDTISPPPAEVLRESLPELRKLRAAAKTESENKAVEEWLGWWGAADHLNTAIFHLEWALAARDARLKETP